MIITLIFHFYLSLSTCILASRMTSRRLVPTKCWAKMIGDGHQRHHSLLYPGTECPTLLLGGAGRAGEEDAQLGAAVSHCL